MAFFGLFKLKHLAVTGCTRSLLSNPTFRVGREKRGGPPKNFFDFFFNIWILVSIHSTKLVIPPGTICTKHEIILARVSTLQSIAIKGGTSNSNETNRHD